MMFERLFPPRPTTLIGRALFKAVSAQARQPALYVDGGAADTVEGRFELYVLHLVLLLERLKGHGPQATETAQAVFDAFLNNLEEGLREMGVGDLSVGKKMRKLGEAVYGRIKSYDAALANVPDTAELKAVIARTVLQDAPGCNAETLAAYAAEARASLAAQPLEGLLDGRVAWPPPAGA